MTVARAEFSFETERLYLRPLSSADEKLYCALYTDPGTMRHIGPPLSPRSAARSFREALHLANGKAVSALYLAIFERTTMQPLGICGVRHFDPAATSLEIGVVLLACARGAGYARESKTGLARRIFALLPASEIWVEYQRGNLAAARSNLSIGFAHDDSGAIGNEDAGTCRMVIRRGIWRCSDDGTRQEMRPLLLRPLEETG